MLDILKKIDMKIIIVSKNINETLKERYESQYNNIRFINNNSFHDRFIILDKNKLYSCGASFKDLGKKCFAINEFKEADKLSDIDNAQLSLGNADDLAQIQINTLKAETMLQTTVQITSRVVNAYKEIMSIQV